jgi:hypothetical protein
MKKSVGFYLIRVAKPLGMRNFRNSDTVCKVCLFFTYDQRPSVSNRDLATMVRTPHEGCYVHRIRRVRLHT